MCLIDYLRCCAVATGHRRLHHTRAQSHQQLGRLPCKPACLPPPLLSPEEREGSTGAGQGRVSGKGPVDAVLRSSKGPGQSREAP